MRRQHWIILLGLLGILNTAFSFDPASFKRRANEVIVSRVYDKEGNFGHIPQQQALEAASQLTQELITQEKFGAEEALKTAYQLVEKHPAVKGTCEFKESAPEVAQYKADRDGGNYTSPPIGIPKQDNPKIDDKPCPVGALMVEDLNRELDTKLQQIEKVAEYPVKPANEPKAPPPPAPAPPESRTNSAQGNQAPGAILNPFQGPLFNQPVLGKPLPNSETAAVTSSPSGHGGDNAFALEQNENSSGTEAPIVSKGPDNLSIFRAALDGKVARGEVQPAVAEALLNHFSPLIQKEADLTTALNKGVSSYQLARSNEQPNQIAPSIPPTFASPSTKESRSLSSVAATDSAAADRKSSPTTLFLGSAPNALGAGANAGNGVTTQPSPKGSVAKAVGLALQKKNTPVPSKETATSATPTTSMALTSAGLLFSGQKGAGLALNSKKPETTVGKTALVESTALGSFIDSVAALFRPKSMAGAGLRSIASTNSEKTAKSDHALAMAALAHPGESEAELPELTAEQGYAAFFSAFSLSLVGLGMWVRWKRKSGSEKPIA